MQTTSALLLTSLLLVGSSSSAQTADPKELVNEVVKAAGGESRILRLFRMKERLNVSPDPEKTPSERVSIVEPPLSWWLGTEERGPEPAKLLVYAWTLGALTDPDSRLEVLPEIVELEKPAVGLRVSGSIEPPMDLYFDRESRQLVRIDWRSDIHRFRDWKELGGARYPARCVGYKKATGKPWYFSEILEVERLEALPEGLKR